MWKIMFIILLLIFPINTIAKVTEPDELIEMTNFAVSHDLEIEEWQVIVKEQLNEQTLKRVLKELKNSYKVTMIEDDNVIRYQTRDGQKMDGFTVTFIVLLPKDGISHPELVIHLDGTYWNEIVSEDYHDTINIIKQQYFTKNEQTFSWLKFKQDGILYNDIIELEIIGYFDLQEVETQFDKNRNLAKNINKVIYGYTSLWKNKLIINNKEKNLQVAITMDEKGNTEYIIGTPILINEY